MRHLFPAALAGLVLAALPAHAQDAPSFFDGADPDFEVAEGQYWLYPTFGGKTLAAWHSLDMRKWEKGPVLLDHSMIPWIE
ncbi:MAG TPA: hypothetical protein VN029_00160, partial [Sphingomonas sp.]|nr:hypothetical protein [Sphingomonas sp.]